MPVYEVPIGAGTTEPLRVHDIVTPEGIKYGRAWRLIQVVVKGKQWGCAIVLAIARLIAIAVITTACALSSFTANTAIITACALPSFTATPFIITTYVSLDFCTFRVIDDVGEDALKVLFSLEALSV